MTSESMPEDFSKITDEELAVMSRKGDIKAQNILFAKYYPVVTLTASNYMSTALDKEDMAQEGMIGFLSAIYTFDPDKNTSFRTYASVCVNNSIRSALKTKANSQNSPLSAYVPLDDIMMPVSSPEETVISEDNLRRIKAMITASLSELERNVLSLRLSALDYKTISAKLGITEKATDNAMQRIRTKLKKVLVEFRSK